MRKIKLALQGLVLAGLTLMGQTADAQQPKWLLQNSSGVGVYDMSTATPSLNTTLTMYTSTAGVGGRCAVYKPDGSVLFSIYGGQIFSSTNTFVANLPVEKTYAGPYPGEQFINYLNPMQIVPVPQTCDKYYVIYTLTYGPGDLLGAHKLVYCVLDLSSGTPVVDPNSLVTYLVNGIDYGFRIPKTIPGSNFAISKSIDVQNQRYMYVISSGQVKVDRYLISSTGISLVNTIFQGSSDVAHPTSQFYFAELELSPDQQHLAFGAYAGSTQLLYQINLSNYAYSSFASKAFPLTYAYGQFVYGIEYNSSSDRLFMSTIDGLLYYTDATSFGTSATTAFTSTSGQFSYTNLELGKSGNIYAVTSGGNLYAVNTATPAVTNTGIVTQNSGMYNNYFSFPLPLQIDGDDYSNFTGNASPVSAFNINGVASGNTPPQFIDVYSCNNITLNNLSSYGYIPPMMLYQGFSCTVQSCDVNGNVVSGSGYLNYSSGWRFPGNMNLKSLPTGSIFSPGAPETWLADPAHVGYYKITATARNSCGATSSKVAYLRVNASPSPVTMNLQMIQGQGLTCYSQNIGTICDQTGIYSVGFNLGTSGSTFASNNISNYSRKIEEVDCSNGSVTSLLYEDTTPIVPANPNGSMIGLNLNQAIINGAPGYFASNPSTVLGKCYKLSITVSNPCSSFTDWTYFKINPAGFWSSKAKLPEGEFSLYPNPAQNTVTLQYKGNQKGTASFSVYDVQGRLLLDKQQLDNADMGYYKQRIDISSLSKGLYIYKFNNGQEIVSGQFSVL